jgi:hypothetical protein
MKLTDPETATWDNATTQREPGQVELPCRRKEPLAKGGELLGNQTVTGIARRLGRTPAQVVPRWHLQLGNGVIPKSVTPSRIAENLDVFGFELTGEDMAALTALDKGLRTGRTRTRSESFACRESGGVAGRRGSRYEVLAEVPRAVGPVVVAEAAVEGVRVGAGVGAAYFHGDTAVFARDAFGFGDERAADSVAARVFGDDSPPPSRSFEIRDGGDGEYAVDRCGGFGDEHRHVWLGGPRGDAFAHRGFVVVVRVAELPQQSRDRGGVWWLDGPDHVTTR